LKLAAWISIAAVRPELPELTAKLRRLPRFWPSCVRIFSARPISPFCAADSSSSGLSFSASAAASTFACCVVGSI
jgi:hypothetical protein